MQDKGVAWPWHQICVLQENKIYSEVITFFLSILNLKEFELYVHSLKGTLILQRYTALLKNALECKTLIDKNDRGVGFYLFLLY